ncbi:hypothetical protein D3C73_1432840 [compost metagenome]
MLFLIHKQNASGHIVQHALQQILVVADRAELGLQAVRHHVDGAGQLADLILAPEGHPGVVIQVGNAPGHSCNLLQRRGKPVSDPVTDQRGCDEQ